MGTVKTSGMTMMTKQTFHSLKATIIYKNSDIFIYTRLIIIQPQSPHQNQPIAPQSQFTISPKNNVKKIENFNFTFFFSILLFQKTTSAKENL